ncbi:MAG: hypothetical protein KDD52_02955 [Bdellovibrionales bacterium]|nr:hypothetical protein [Bdellovibrionales bacterium]
MKKISIYLGILGIVFSSSWALAQYEDEDQRIYKVNDEISIKYSVFPGYPWDIWLIMPNGACEQVQQKYQACPLNDPSGLTTVEEDTLFGETFFWSCRELPNGQNFDITVGPVGKDCYTPTLPVKIRVTNDVKVQWITLNDGEKLKLYSNLGGIKTSRGFEASDKCKTEQDDSQGEVEIRKCKENSPYSVKIIANYQMTTSIQSYEIAVIKTDPESKLGVPVYTGSVSAY